MRLITRLIAWFLGIGLGIVALLFTIGSHEPVTLTLWGIPDYIQMPLFLAVLGGWVIGFFCGAIVMWFSNGHWRRLARQRQRELHDVREENAELRQEMASMRRAADAADQSRTRAVGYSPSDPANNNLHRPMLPGRAQ